MSAKSKYVILRAQGQCYSKNDVKILYRRQKCSKSLSENTVQI